MPQYRVTYGNAKGLAEPLRWILSYAEQPFEDRRTTSDEEWQKIKPTSPFGIRPMLEVDGKVLCQSGACMRYLARAHGLYGANDWEAAQIDQAADCMDDIIKPIWSIYGEKDEARKAELKKKYAEEQLPGLLTNLEKLLVSGGGDYFVGNKLSYADIKIVHQFNFVDMFGEYKKESYPKLQALRNRVENEPKIKAWIDKRPDTQF